jgi:hypothetical protein
MTTPTQVLNREKMPRGWLAEIPRAACKPYV